MERIEWDEVCPICKARKEGFVFCCGCVHRLKPTGGRDNDPESICTEERMLNFVTGEMEAVLCKDKNRDGGCAKRKDKGGNP